MAPAYIKIANIPKEKFRLVGRVKVLDVFQNNTRDFHDDGLFSTTIFGRVGSPDRITRMGYIDFHVPIFHPRIFNHICSLKQLYKGILSGKEYAVWDSSEKDFVKCDVMEPGANTGFNFFLSHWKEIKFKRTNSGQRDQRIAIVNDNRDIALQERLPVIPAGLRDLEVDEHGGTDQHEINDFYRTIIRISNTLSTINDLDSPIIDKARYALQMAYNELHDYIMTNTIKGKGSFFSSKFGRRKIKYGTRNVWTAISLAVESLDDPTNITNNHTVVGLFQAMKATEPLMIHHLNTQYLNRVFRGEGTASLIDPKTMARVDVTLKPRSMDKWTTNEGIIKLINQFENPKVRNKPIKVEGYYLGLVYKRDGYYKLMYSLDEIPQDRQEDKGYVTPITYGELFFILINRYNGDLPADITRYPIEGTGSIYPSYNYVTTTINSLRMVELDEAWQPTEFATRQYPNVDMDKWLDAMSPHSTRVPDAGGDYDGDTGNNNVNMSEEAKEAVKDYLSSIQAHIDANGNMLASPFTDIPIKVIFNLTGD